MIRDRFVLKIGLSLATSVLLSLFALSSSAQTLELYSEQKVSSTTGGFPAMELDAGDLFGSAIVEIGDLDGNGSADLAVGAIGDDDGGIDPSFIRGRGAVWVLMLDSAGTVIGTEKISADDALLAGDIDEFDDFGYALGSVGDLDGDSIPDIVVGAPGDDDGGTDRGALWVVMLQASGAAKSVVKISSTAGGFGGALSDSDRFGSSVAGIGDVDGDGVTDLLVGAPGDDDAGTDRGAVWVVFLNATGTVKMVQKISATLGGFTGPLADGDRFGCSVAGLGLLDGDIYLDVAVGAKKDDNGGASAANVGAVWVLFLDSMGLVVGEQKISASDPLLSGELDDQDEFGAALALVDFESDGMPELAVGAPRDDDGGEDSDTGAVYTLTLNSDGTVADVVKISATEGNFNGTLDADDMFGGALAAVTDLDGILDGDLSVGANLDDDGGTSSGALWNLFFGLRGLSTIRNGSDVNGLGFSDLGPMTVGQPWQTTVDLGTPPAAASIVVVSIAGPTSGVILSGFINGELLILPPFVTRKFGTGSHSIAIPMDVSLVGAMIYTQAATIDPQDIQLLNAIDAVVGSH